MKEFKTKKYSQQIDPLYGKSKQSAKNFIYKLVEPYTKGVFRDNSWQPINSIWRLFSENNIDCEMTKPPQYFNNESGMPVRKDWYFKISFLNNKQKQDEINGTITASGAGSVQDPLDAYDVVVVMF